VPSRPHPASSATSISPRTRVQDAFAAAVRRRPDDGVPPSLPAGSSRLPATGPIGRLRRESTREVREARAALLAFRPSSRRAGGRTIICGSSSPAVTPRSARPRRSRPPSGCSAVIARPAGARADHGATHRAGQGQASWKRGDCWLCCCSSTPAGRSTPLWTVCWCFCPIRTAAGGTPDAIADGQAIVRSLVRRNRPGAEVAVSGPGGRRSGSRRRRAPAAPWLRSGRPCRAHSSSGYRCSVSQPNAARAEGCPSGRSCSRWGR
jgi:hypothetical protein